MFKIKTKAIMISKSTFENFLIL